MNPKRVLIIKFGAIGDVVMALPAVYQVHLAGYTVDWICGPQVLPLLQLYPWLRAIPADDKAILTGSAMTRLRAIVGLWKSVLPRPYKFIATLYYDSRYRLLALPLRSQRKFLLSHTDRRYRLLPGRHHTDEYARILLDLPDQHRSHQLAPVLPLSFPELTHPRTQKPRVVLAPAGARNMMNDDALRRWPAESYVELARLLLKQGIEVILIGGPDDAWVQPLFASLPGIVDLIGTQRLPQTLALLDSADVTVTHDTGPLHLAGITRTGIITLFGPTDPRGRLPQRPGAVALWGGEGFACRPCYDSRTFAPCPQNDCIRQYTPAMVFAEVQAMLADRARNHLPPPRVATPDSTNGGLTLIR